jgi:serine/threonine-protein kinase RsbW
MTGDAREGNGDDRQPPASDGVAARLGALDRDAREARAQLDAVVSSAPAILWRWDPVRRCIYVSDGWTTLLGRATEEALGAGWAQSVHPDDRVRFTERCESRMMAGESFSAEYRLRRADGTYIRVHDQGRPTEGVAGQAEFVGAALDVTEQHLRRLRAEQLEALATALAGSRSPVEVADAVLDHALDALEAPYGALGLPLPKGDAMTLQRQRGFDAKRDAWQELPLDDPTPLTRAFVEGEPLFFGDADAVIEMFPHLDGELMPYRARAALPLLGRGSTLGTLYVAFDDAKTFDPETRRFFEGVADMIAGSLERAMLAEERERAAAETRILLDVTMAIGRAVTTEAVRDVAANAAKLAVGADACLVGIVDRGANRVDYGDEAPYPRELVPLLPTSLAAGSSPVADAIADAAALRYARSEEIVDRYPDLDTLLEQLPFRSRMFVPIVGTGEALGVMVASSEEEDRFDIRDQRILEAIGRQCGLALERAHLMEAEAQGRHELERALSRLSRLASVTSALSLAVESEEVARVVLDATCEALGGDGGVVLVEEDDTLRRASISGIAADSPYGQTLTFDVDAQTSLFDAYRSGHVVWLPTEVEWQQRYPHGAQLFAGRAKAVIAIPFVIEDRVLGAMGVYFERERSLTRAERRLARTIGEQGAQAFERARLYEAERRRGRRAERLQRVSMELAVAATQEEVGRVLTATASEAVGAQAGLVIVRDEGRARVVAASGFPRELVDRIADTAIDEPLPGNDVIAARLPSLLRNQDEIAARYPHVDPSGPHLEEHAWATLPFLVDGRAIGAIHLSFAEPQEFGVEQLSDLAVIVAEAGQAMHRAGQYAREREASAVLQESLLPREPSVTSHQAQVVSRYWAGTDHLDVGGDWWDVIELPNGRLGLAIGDVVGRGLHAAAAMGQLRSALRGLALDCRGPGKTLEAVDRFAMATPGTELATLVYGELDPRTGEFCYACAGHPPPVALEGGRARVLDEGRSPMLAAGYSGPRSEAPTPFTAGTVIVLYTDGFVERRGETFDRGIERLLDALEATEGLDLGSLSDAITERVLEPGDRSDDAAFICLRIGELAPTLTRSIDADPGAISTLRRELATWMSAQGVGDADGESVLVAVTEAAANAIEHGYRSEASGPVEVEATLMDGALRVTVRDHGSWRDGVAGADRGRGMLLMRGLMDAVDVRREPTGTTVTMQRRVGRMAEGAPSR